MPATVLITGANGYIGSQFSKLMESIGHKVEPIDVAPRLPDLSPLGINAASHIINVADAAAFRPVCEKAKPTRIFHAAPPLLGFLHSKEGRQAVLKGGLSSARNDISSRDQKSQKVCIQRRYLPEESEKKFTESQGLKAELFISKR
jgi:NAD-dependent epimerase/dehydratase family protein